MTASFRWILYAGTSLLALSCLWGGNASGAPEERVAGRVLVKARAGVPEAVVQNAFTRIRAREHGTIPQIGVRIVSVHEPSFAKMLGALKLNRNIEWAEPDYVVEPALTPNDPYYAFQWHLPKISAPAAWDLTIGRPDVVVAILDSGMDSAHSDFAGKVVAGWNFFDNNSNTSDVTGHGTGVAGTAVGCGNNGVGVAPVAFGCKVMPIRVADTKGYASISAIASALVWAADQGVRVANASFSIGGTDSTLASAAQYFQSKGGVFVVSAGNEGTFDSSPDSPYMLRVSAIESSDLIATYSSTGNNIDLCAPGSSILTMLKGGSFGSGTGTSFAAPVVAGVAALVISANSALTGVEAMNILKQSTDDLGAPGWDATYGSGRVNALKAVQAAISAGAMDSTAPTAQITSPASGAVVSGSVMINVTASDNVGVTGVALYINGVSVASSAGASASFAWDTRQYANGSYTLRVRASDAAGNTGDSAVVTVTVQNVVPDTTLPVVGVTAPASGATVSGIFTVGVSATDNVGVTRVEWYLNGTLAGSSSGATASFQWDTKTVANGLCTVQAKAYDLAGNVGSSASVSVNVANVVPDTTPPVVSITSPVGGTKITLKSTPVTVLASDNVKVARVDLLVDGKRYATSTSATPTFTWNTSKLSRGSHTLQSVAYDAHGNSARSSVVTVTK